jgi:hypothetical protein
VTQQGAGQPGLADVGTGAREKLRLHFASP